MDKVMLAENIYWVGVVDWNIRDFHGYVTQRGSTYNAYLILDEKNVLVDTVKHAFSEELLKNISETIDPEKLEYVIVNHVEMDHSGSLTAIAERAKNATIVSSQRGKDAITEHYGSSFNIQTVKTGDELKIGKRTLRFIEAPMLHWPDSMFTYVVEDKILMPNDAFGQHLATSKRFDDEVDQHVLMEEAATYYANILTPLGSLIKQKIQEVVQAGLVCSVIAPSHGVIWRTDPSKIIKAYSEWSEGVSKNKVVIVYDTMWGSTDKMARSIEKGAASKEIDVKLLKLRAANQTEAATEILDSKAVIIGSPTLNNGMFPTLGAFLTYITGLKPKGKLWGFFGSYGWGGGAVKSMTEIAKKAGFEVHEPSIEVKYIPDDEDLRKCFEFGAQIATKIRT